MPSEAQLSPSIKSLSANLLRHDCEVVLDVDLKNFFGTLNHDVLLGSHQALDVWFEDVVKKHVSGPVEMFRYCDYLVICYRYKMDGSELQTRNI